MQTAMLAKIRSPSLMLGPQSCRSATATRPISLRSRSLTITSASSDDQSSTEAEASTSAPLPKVYTQMPDGRAAPQRPPSQVPPGTKYERVEKLGKDSWAGVAAVDRGETPTDLGRIALLIGGDLAVLLLFATIGRVSHHEPFTVGAVFGTALPFILGWFLAAGLLGGYGKEAQGGNTGAAALTTLKCWAVGWPIAMVLRTLGKGYLPDKSFIIVSIVVTTLLLVGWRSVLASKTPNADGSKKSGNRKGNPFEFLQLLFGLTSRW